MTLGRGWNGLSVKASGTGSGGTSSSRGTAVPQPSSSSNEPFVDLLDFGTSVVVNEDIVRVIGGEVHEIEESINVVNSETKKEAMLERQLHQDLSHSHSELSNLSRGAMYQLENVNVHSTFLRGLEDALHTDLDVSSVIKRCTSTAVVVSPLPAGVRAGQVAAKGDGPDWSAQKNETYEKIAQRRGEKLKEVTATMKETSMDVDGIFEMQRNTTETMKAIHRRLEMECLDSLVEQKKKEADRIEEELKQETEKLQSFKLATNKSRTERCSEAQELADLTKKQEETRRDGETQTKELLTKHAAHTDSTKRRQLELAQTKSILEKTKADIQEQLDQNRLMQSLAETKSALDQEQKRNNELLHLVAELAPKLKVSQEELQGSKERLQKAQGRETEVLKLKEENDERHNSILVPGRVELSDIAEKKVEVSKHIEACQKSNSELEISDKEHLDSKLATKRAVLEDLSTLKEEEKSVKAKKESMRLAYKQSKEARELEIEEFISHEKKLRAAFESKQAHLEEVREAQSKRIEMSVEESVKLAEIEKEKGERLVKVLKRGVDLIQEADARLGKLGKSLEW